eukprot:6191598-Amphidinium_carterae.1
MDVHTAKHLRSVEQMAEDLAAGVACVDKSWVLEFAQRHRPATSLVKGQILVVAADSRAADRHHKSKRKGEQDHTSWSILALLTFSGGCCNIPQCKRFAKAAVALSACGCSSVCPRAEVLFEPSNRSAPRFDQVEPSPL